MLVPAIGKRDQKTGIGDRPHLREKPFLVDRFGGPSTAPASRRKGCPPAPLAFSSCSRTIRPFGSSVLREVSANHGATSEGILTVSVLLMCSDCNTRLIDGN